MATERTVFSQHVKIGNRKFLVTSDDDYLKHIGENFEPDMCNLFQLLLHPHFNVVDAGANIGCTSLLFGSLVARVDSFEPSPSTFKLLALNVENAALHNVNLHNCGLGVKDEDLTLTFAPSNRSGGFVSNITQASIGHAIENIKIKNGDSLLSGRKVDFIKIDVEGFEKNVIEGLRGVIQQNHPIVVLELNHWCLNAFQRTSIPDFFDFLLEKFPILYAIDGTTYADLHDQSNRYTVMYHHIIHFKYPNLVGAFDRGQVERLLSTLTR
jgi:FkbM family methyltransferase